MSNVQTLTDLKTEKEKKGLINKIKNLAKNNPEELKKLIEELAVDLPDLFTSALSKDEKIATAQIIAAIDKINDIENLKEISKHIKRKIFPTEKNFRARTVVAEYEVGNDNNQAGEISAIKQHFESDMEVDIQKKDNIYTAKLKSKRNKRLSFKDKKPFLVPGLKNKDVRALISRSKNVSKKFDPDEKNKLIIADADSEPLDAQFVKDTKIFAAEVQTFIQDFKHPNEYSVICSIKDALKKYNFKFDVFNITRTSIGDHTYTLAPDIVAYIPGGVAIFEISCTLKNSVNVWENLRNKMVTERAIQENNIAVNDDDTIYEVGVLFRDNKVSISCGSRQRKNIKTEEYQKDEQFLQQSRTKPKKYGVLSSSNSSNKEKKGKKLGFGDVSKFFDIEAQEEKVKVDPKDYEQLIKVEYEGEEQMSGSYAEEKLSGSFIKSDNEGVSESKSESENESENESSESEKFTKKKRTLQQLNNIQPPTKARKKSVSSSRARANSSIANSSRANSRRNSSRGNKKK